jgi:hypothetical protein
VRDGNMSRVEVKDAATLIKMLNELGLGYQETVDLLSTSLSESNSGKKLFRGENKRTTSPLIKLGATVFIVPAPIISESLGIILMSAGLFQDKIKGPPIQIEDVYETCQQINNELRKMKL